MAPLPYNGTMTKTIKNDLTTGNITKKLIAFALPLIASNFLQLMYSTADMAIVGSFVGKEGVAAISSGSEIINLFSFVCISFCNGGQTLIAQLVGANKKERFKNAVNTLFISTLVFGLIVASSMILFHTSIIRILKVPNVSVAMANSYLLICGIGCIFSFCYNAIAGSFRGFGESKKPLRIIAISTVTNIILDLLFVAVFKLGVTGAAIATAMGQALSFLMILYSFTKDNVYGDYKHSFKQITFDTRDLKIISDIGVPLSVQSAAVHFSMIYINRIINTLGVVAAATFAIGIKIDDLCAKTSLGFQYAGGPMVAQNYSKKDYRRVEDTVKHIWILSGILHVVFVLIYVAFADKLFAFFLDDNAADVLALAPTFVKNIIWTFIPLAILRGTNSLLQGIGAGKISLVFGIIDSVICRIGLSLLFGTLLNGGFAGFVLGYGLAPAGAAIPGLIYFLSGKWKNKKQLSEI